MFLDRLRKVGEIGIAKGAARIARIGLNEFDRHLAIARRQPADARYRRFVDLADESRKAATQSPLGKIFVHSILPKQLLLDLGRTGAHAARSLRSWRMTSDAKLQIGLTAGAFEVIEDRRLSVGKAPRRPAHSEG